MHLSSFYIISIDTLLVSMLIKKHKRAVAGLAETKEAYLALENSLDATKTRVWKRQEQKANKGNAFCTSMQSIMLIHNTKLQLKLKSAWL